MPQAYQTSVAIIPDNLSTAACTHRKQPNQIMSVFANRISLWIVFIVLGVWGVMVLRNCSTFCSDISQGLR
jgi:hypothetical protein